MLLTLQTKNEKRQNGFIFLVNSGHIHTEKLKFQACALKTDKLVPMIYIYIYIFIYIYTVEQMELKLVAIQNEKRAC